MNIHQIVQDQYGAAMEMLKQAVAKCPEDRWNDQDDHKKFWRVAYHVLLYIHLYLQDTDKDFKPWSKRRESSDDPRHVLGAPKKDDETYSKEEILEYLQFCQEQIAEKVPALDLEKESGFPWLPFNKLELQLYNIRHLQHHAAELIEWLGAKEDIEIDWIIKSPVSQG